MKKDQPSSLQRRLVRGGLLLLTTIVGNLALFLGGVVFGGGCLLASFIPPRGRWSVPVTRGWSRVLLWGTGARLERRYEEALDPKGCYIFMANHQSLLDIPAATLSLPGQFRFLAKRSLFRIPIFGWAMSAAGFVPVDRDRRERATETFAGALGVLRQGTSLLIFPEETRSCDGQLREFQRGGFLMALKQGLSIVPVGIHGTLQVRRKGSLWTRSGTVKVGVGRPIKAADYGLKRKQELIEVVTREVARLAAVPDPEASAGV